MSRAVDSVAWRRFLQILSRAVDYVVWRLRFPATIKLTERVRLNLARLEAVSRNNGEPARPPSVRYGRSWVPPGPDGSSICPIDDGYSWRKYGQQSIPGWGYPTFYYECAQANCVVKKSVALAMDGQIVETVFGGSHNHPRPSAAGASVPRTGDDGGAQLPGSSDSEEDDDGEARADGVLTTTPMQRRDIHQIQLKALLRKPLVRLISWVVAASVLDMSVEGDQEAATEQIVKEVVQNWSLEWKLLGITLPKSLGDAAILGLEKNHLKQSYLLAKKKWHLTFYLLEAALQFSKELPYLEQMESRQYPPKPSCTELEVAEDFCYLVRPIYHAIKVVSSPCNVTLNSHFHAIWNLKIALMASSIKENIDEVFDVRETQMKFDKLWRKWYLWLSLAVILDPRYKFRFLVFCLNEAYGNDAKRYILEVRGKMYELFLQYSCHVDQESGEDLNQRNNDLQLDTHGNVPVHGSSQNYIEQSAHEELGELIGYLEGEVIPENVPFDILKWWKDNATTYPTLARLARDILAIPGCAVAAESAFDETDERVSLFNRKVSPEVVEALICTQDWIKSSEINDEVGGNGTMPT
ncbi:hypothetical protein ACP70R_003066 [Stipagrostis hirtigluma subsp. patula]